MPWVCLWALNVRKNGHEVAAHRPGYAALAVAVSEDRKEKSRDQLRSASLRSPAHRLHGWLYGAGYTAMQEGRPEKRDVLFIVRGEQPQLKNRGTTWALAFLPIPMRFLPLELSHSLELARTFSIVSEKKRKTLSLSLTHSPRKTFTDVTHKFHFRRRKRGVPSPGDVSLWNFRKNVDARRKMHHHFAASSNMRKARLGSLPPFTVNVSAIDERQCYADESSAVPWPKKRPNGATDHTYLRRSHPKLGLCTTAQHVCARRCCPLGG